MASHLRGFGEGRGQRIGDGGIRVGLDLRVDGGELAGARKALGGEPPAEIDDGVALVLPERLLFLGAVIVAVDVADVVAEGIEVEADARTLVDLGVTLGQGWFLARPVPVEALPRGVLWAAR